MSSMACLQLLVTLVAAIEIVISISTLIILGAFAVVLKIKRDALLKFDEGCPDEHHYLQILLEASVWQLIFIFLPLVIYFVCEVVLGVVLYKAAHKANRQTLCRWLIATLILVGVGLIVFIIEVVGVEDPFDIVLIYSVNFLFTLLSVGLVYWLICRIKAGDVHQLVPITDHEKL